MEKVNKNIFFSKSIYTNMGILRTMASAKNVSGVCIQRGATRKLPCFPREFEVG